MPETGQAPDAGAPLDVPQVAGPQAGRPGEGLLRLVLMGTGPFAVPSFEALAAAGHPVSLVVTRPQRPTRSRTGPPPSPVRQWAEQRGLATFDPASINDRQAVERVAQAGPDLLVVCDYGQILRPAALAVAPLGGINLHGSLLPAYRGAAPVQWAIRQGESHTGVSVIHMTPQLDGGPVLATRQTAIGDEETAGQLEQRLAALGVDAVRESVALLGSWDRKSPLGRPQDEAVASKAPRLEKAAGRIDWGTSARQIDRHVRAMQPWPMAFTELVEAGRQPVRVAILQVTRLPTPPADQTPGASPGAIVADADLCVVCGEGLLRVDRLQPAGRRVMSGQEFLRGRPLTPDARFA